MKNIDKRTMNCGLIIFLSFTFTACGYLSWLYHLMEYVPSSSADWMTEVIGYFFQAFGYLVFALLMKRFSNNTYKKAFFPIVIILDFLMICLASLAKGLAPILVFGYAMNLMHGIVGGYYLLFLSRLVSWNHRAKAFGFAYGASSLLTWVLSLIGEDVLLHTPLGLPIYAVLAVITIILVFREKMDVSTTSSTAETSVSKADFSFSFLLLAGIVVVLLSLIKNVGFYFPMADLSQGISLEFSRLFYAIGLVVAGILSDKNRRYGAISCLCALAFPFALLALKDSLGVSVLIWIMGYLLFGFFTVYRTVLFSDIADTQANLLFVCGFGMMFGRIGDALGAWMGMVSTESFSIVVVLSALLYGITIALFFMLYQKLYLVSAPAAELTEEEKLSAFIAQYELSSREISVFNLLLEARSNSEIAATLFISENTVKFHIHNILKKTNCKNRNELLAKVKEL